MSDQKHVSKSETTSSNQILGGILGAIGGWVFLTLTMHLMHELSGTPNFLLQLIGLVVAISNLVGFFAYPIIGFAIGYKHAFTTARTRIGPD